MFEQKNIKKIISGVILSCLVSIPSLHLASEHESVQEKKQTKYDIAKKLIKGAAQGYGTYLSGSVVHEFGHWFTGKIIHKCNGFFCINPFGNGSTYLYYNSTNREIILELLKRQNIKNYQPKLLHLKRPPNHPVVAAAGSLFGIGYNLLAQRKALQSNMFSVVLGAQISLAENIADFSPFGSRDDGNKILEYFNINCPPHYVADIGFQIAAAIVSVMLGVWNIKAVLPATAS